jgi:hypothetical protein
MQERNYTNENLNKRFNNPFALVNYAIRLAKKHVREGDWVDTNPANEVLELISSGDDEEEELETQEAV